MDAVSLRDQPEQCTVAIETPGKADSGDLQAGLAVTVEDLIAKAASGIPIGEGDGNVTMPLHIHHRDEGVWEDALYCCSPGQLLQLCHRTHMPLPKSISLNVRSLYYITAIRWKRAEVVEKTSREREAVNSCCLHTQRGCMRGGDGALQIVCFSASYTSHCTRSLVI